MLKLFQIQPGCTTLYNLVVYRGNIMISIKDYAKNNNVSYEAIHRRIKRNEEVFKGHIVKKTEHNFLMMLQLKYWTIIKKKILLL